jgi:hypothetical protein
MGPGPLLIQKVSNQLNPRVLVLKTNHRHLSKIKCVRGWHGIFLPLRFSFCIAAFLNFRQVQNI